MARPEKFAVVQIALSLEPGYPEPELAEIVAYIDARMSGIAANDSRFPRVGSVAFSTHKVTDARLILPRDGR